MNTMDAKAIALPRPEGAPKPERKRKRKTKRSQGGVYDRNGRWYMQYRVTDPATGAKERRTEPVEGATDRATALLGLEARLRSIVDGTYFAKRNAPAPLMFDAVAEEFLAWARAEKRGPHNYEIAIENAHEVFGGKPLSALTLAALEAFRTRLVRRIVEKHVKRRGEKVTEDERRGVPRLGAGDL